MRELVLFVRCRIGLKLGGRFLEIQVRQYRGLRNMLPDRWLACVDMLAFFFGLTYVFTNAADLFQRICAHGSRQALVGIDVSPEFFFSAFALPTDPVYTRAAERTVAIARLVGMADRRFFCWLSLARVERVPHPCFCLAFFER